MHFTDYIAVSILVGCNDKIMCLRQNVYRYFRPFRLLAVHALYGHVTVSLERPEIFKQLYHAVPVVRVPSGTRYSKASYSPLENQKPFSACEYIRKE